MHLFLRSIFRLLCVAVAFVFIAGYVAAYVPPTRLWWTGLAAIGFPATLALVVGLTLVLFIRRRRHRLLLRLFVILLLLGAIRAARPAWWSSAPVPGDEDLTVLTWNLPHTDLPNSGPGELEGVLREAEPFIIGTQESPLYERRAPRSGLVGNQKTSVIIDSLGYVVSRPPYVAEQRIRRWRQAVFTRDTVVSQRQIEFQFGEKDVSPLRAVRTEFVWQGRPAVHYNIHLETHGAEKPWAEQEIRLFDPTFWRPYLENLKLGFEKRAWQARQLKDVIDRETLPTIISGDLNSTQHNWSFRHISSGFEDVFSRVGSGWGATYHARWPLFRIDFVLATPEWQAVSARVPRTGPDLSDHRPLVASLRWAATD